MSRNCQMTSPAAGLDQLLDLSIVVSVAIALLGDQSITAEERDVAERYHQDVSPDLVELVRAAIIADTDPLGTAYCAIRSPKDRRGAGQTFTPVEVVLGMFAWAKAQKKSIARIVDPGAGSGRYVLTGLRHLPGATGIAVEYDPLLALILRGNAAALGVIDRLEVKVCDYRLLELPAIEGHTLFIGNPPYVRHHDIAPVWKEWYSNHLRRLNHASSQLAGLHLHFFLKTHELAQPGDIGCFITAAEWLDVNYGQALRDLLTNGLGGSALFVVAPTIPVFGDALVSACITCFAPGTHTQEIELKNIDHLAQLSSLSGGHQVDRAKAAKEKSWTLLVKKKSFDVQEGFVPLGEIFKVSRGQVTGMNKVWVTSNNRFELPDRYLIPSITQAVDIVRAVDSRISELSSLRRVVDLPRSLDTLDADARRAVDAFLKWAVDQDADKGYIAQHRTPWWRVNLKDPPPIVMTYMGRRPPVFALNTGGARLINVAHGLYPRVSLSEQALYNLVKWLNNNISQDSGRVYAGGLTKFEPSEAMRLLIPGIELLEQGLV